MSKEVAKLLVVGMPRSGTSLLGQYLVDMGLRSTVDERADIDYPSGFMEHLPILLFNKSCERLRGGRDRLTWDSLVEESFLDIPCMKAMYDVAYAVFDDTSTDFIKSPDLALAMDFMHEQYPQLHILAIWRRPDCAISSFYKREYGRFPGFKNLIYAVGVWNMYALRLIDFKKRFPELIDIVQIERLVDGQSWLPQILEERGFPIECKLDRPEKMRKPFRTKVNIFWRIIPVLMQAASHISSADKKCFFQTKQNLAQLEKISCYKSCR